MDQLPTCGLTLTSLLSWVLTSIQFRVKTQELETGIISTMRQPSEDSQILRRWVLGTAVAIYSNEMQGLLGEESGLKLTAYKLEVEQLELGTISFLSNLYQEKALELWGLCCQLDRKSVV